MWHVSSIGGFPVLSPLLGILLCAAAASAQPARADFNGDGYEDLAIGVPGEDIGEFESVGAIHILYGSPGAGLTSTRSQFISLVSLGRPEVWAHFGEGLAAGDFNGDGYSDLAVGAPRARRVTGFDPVGAVDILYGSPLGLTATNNERLTKLAWPTGLCHPQLKWGGTLQAADFDRDGFADLAIGHSRSDVRAVYPGCRQALGNEVVHIAYGSANGLAEGRKQSVERRFVATPALPECDRETTCSFGYSLTAGDFDGNGFPDLAIGAVRTTLGAGRWHGAVHVVFSTPGGLIPFFSQFISQDSPGILGVAQSDELFGWNLAAGDFDGDGADDLVVASGRDPGWDFREINVVRGSPAGLTAAGNLLLEGHQGLSTGDFDRDGFADLAVQGPPWPSEHIRVFQGSAFGLCPSCARLYSQDTFGVPDATEARDRFGEALTTADFNGDGVEDLAVGVPGESLGVEGAGAVTIFYGLVSAGLTSAGSTFWHQNSPGIADTIEEFDFYGSSLSH